MRDELSEFKEIVSMTGRYLEQLGKEGQKDIHLRAGVKMEERGDTVTALDQLREEVASCCKCGLCKTRQKTVFGAGSPTARLMLIGEAPGAEEDKQGIPFVGRAGQLLTKMLQAIGLEREKVYITNILKCRPPNNRDPLPKEVDSCEPYLLAQLELVRPTLICVLGRHAAQTLLKTTQGINKLRGQLHDYRGIKVIPTYHPAYLLRSPAEKRKAWEDLKKVQKLLKSGTSN